MNMMTVMMTTMMMMMMVIRGRHGEARDATTPHNYDARSKNGEAPARILRGRPVCERGWALVSPLGGVLWKLSPAGAPVEARGGPRPHVRHGGSARG